METMPESRGEHRDEESDPGAIGTCHDEEVDVIVRIGSSEGHGSRNRDQTKPRAPSRQLMAKDLGDTNPLLGEDALLPTSVGWSRGSPSNFTPLDDQIGPQDRVIPDERF